jgi:hypothetical protein
MKKKRVSVGIAPDDLQVGHFVSIIEQRKRGRPHLIMGRDDEGDPIMIHTTVKADQTVPGVPHKVLGLSWPWAVFGVLIPGGGIDGPVIHDLRKIRCMRLSEEYVTAIMGFEKPIKEMKSHEDEFEV